MGKTNDLKTYNGVTMYASEYYYNCLPDTWDLMLYKDAIIDRRDSAEILFKALYLESVNRPLNEEVPDELKLRLRKVDKAFKDNKKLCDEKSLII